MSPPFTVTPAAASRTGAPLRISRTLTSPAAGSALPRQATCMGSPAFTFKAGGREAQVRGMAKERSSPLPLRAVIEDTPSKLPRVMNPDASVLKVREMLLLNSGRMNVITTSRSGRGSPVRPRSSRMNWPSAFVRCRSLVCSVRVIPLTSRDSPALTATGWPVERLFTSASREKLSVASRSGTVNSTTASAVSLSCGPTGLPTLSMAPKSKTTLAGVPSSVCEFSVSRTFSRALTGIGWPLSSKAGRIAIFATALGRSDSRAT